eukprot:TRINITY_DN8672_c0_g1_i1.p1 TRINITY_DN8672_c0_g1~~TRINITY_DN8672_c0_g1_i1.p1  ORF type:complete len:419 (+),score=151.80 TRINITY_DN8672_c0_g1_i1:76-1332(+)
MAPGRRSADVVVLGSGILGSMHARAARRAGLSVICVDRDAMPSQASVRNFGYHTSVKVKQGVAEGWARRTGEVYRELDAEGALRYHRTGGMQVAETPAQFALLTEFASKAAGLGHAVTLLSAEDAVEANPILAGTGVTGALLFHDNGVVSSRRLFHTFHPYLERQGVSFEKGVDVTGVRTVGGGVEVALSSGATLSAGHVICSLGAHAPLLRPLREASGMQAEYRLVKLQMMRLRVPPHSVKIPVTGSRTMLFYPLFHQCEAFAAVQRELDAPDCDEVRYGIHNILRPAPSESGDYASFDDDVLTPDEAILGDSHEYAHIDAAHKLDDMLDEKVTGAILKSASQFASHMARDAVLRQWVGYYEVPPTLHYHHRFAAVDTRKGTAQLGADGRVHYVGLAGNGMTFGGGVAEETVAAFAA